MMRAFAYSFDDVARVRAEIDFVADQALRDAAKELEDALSEATGGIGGDEERARYWEAREAFVDATRAALRRDS
jgi:hypothetical protein